MVARPVPEGIRITKVGLWYVVLVLIVSVAATNTGNNALYMVLAVMLATLVVSGIASRHNLRRLEVRLEPPLEIFANSPFSMRYTLRNRGGWVPKWLLVFAVKRGAAPRLVRYLGRKGEERGLLELTLERRGRHQLRYVHLWSLFPLGFFRKGMRYPLGLEVLAYPQLLPAADPRVMDSGNQGDEPTLRAGWGHELLTLRTFRPGDDPRSIHWKQTARTGNMIFMERVAEDSRRLRIVFDNAVGELQDPEAEAEFEVLVSEAATAAVHYLDQGFEVELVTRDSVVPFAGGRRQRLAVLETLALVEPVPLSSEPMFALSSSVARLDFELQPEEIRS